MTDTAMALISYRCYGFYLAVCFCMALEKS